LCQVRVAERRRAGASTTGAGVRRHPRATLRHALAVIVGSIRPWARPIATWERRATARALAGLRDAALALAVGEAALGGGARRARRVDRIAGARRARHRAACAFRALGAAVRARRVDR
jgi:hypothetical protein